MTLKISKINWFLAFKRNKRLLDNKSWEPLGTTLSCIEQLPWIYRNVYITVKLVSRRIKNNKTKDYIHKYDGYAHKYNGKPFHEEKKIEIYKHYKRGKYRKCLPCYNWKWRIFQYWKFSLKLNSKTWHPNLILNENLVLDTKYNLTLK